MTEASGADVAAVSGAVRRALRGVPGAVAIVTTTYAGVRYGIAATAICAVSLDPPSMLVCVNRNSTLHDPISQAERFSINILDEAQGEVVAQFGSSAARGERFTVGEWSEGRGLPLLAGAQASLICRRAQQFGFGTHLIVIGVVEEVETSGTVAPLLYLNAQLTRVAHAGA